MGTQDLQTGLQDKGLKSGVLRQQVVRGGFWVLALRMISRVLAVTRLVILARLLMPDDFGVMGIALLSLAVVETLSQPGFQQALIQKKTDVHTYLNVVWTVGLVRGIVIAAGLFFVGPYIAEFFETSQAQRVIQVLAISILFQSCSNIGMIYYNKNMRFDKFFIVDLVGTIVDFAVTVTAAYFLRNVWALVYGNVFGSAVRCVAGYVVHPFRPRLNWDTDKIKELWRFGKWVFGSGVFVFIIIQCDDFFVGKLIGATALGFYQMAYRISNLPATEIAHVVGKVTFPAYSKLQDDRVKLRNAYLRVLRLTALLAFSIAGLIFSLSGDFVQIFMGDKWMPIVPAMRILVWWGVIRALAGGASPVFLALARPKILTRMQAAQAVLMLLLIYPFIIRWGIVGASAAVLISAFVMFFVRNRILRQNLSCPAWSYYRPIVFPMIFSLLAMAAVESIRWLFMGQEVNIHYFMLLLMIFIVSFVTLALIFDKDSLAQVLLIMRVSTSQTVQDAPRVENKSEFKDK